MSIGPVLMVFAVSSERVTLIANYERINEIFYSVCIQLTLAEKILCNCLKQQHFLSFENNSSEQCKSHLLC